MNKQSKVVTQAKQDIRKSEKHKNKNLVLKTTVNKGKVYPYASTKRGGFTLGPANSTDWGV